MFAYVVRRLLYAIPILIGVNLLTFTLFFVVNSPDDMAASQLGDKYVTPEAIANWKRKNGYDKPLFLNSDAGGLAALTDTIFFTKSVRLFAFDFGRSESGRDITTDVSTRMWPSLAVALPSFLVGIAVNICVALMVVMFRATVLDRWAVFVFVALMSISYLFYIIGGQYLVAKQWMLVPISGFDPDFQPWKFLILPVLVAVVSGIGSGARWYRTLFLEEAGHDYVRTARAKGASEISILFRHILPNALIPILTGVVVLIPTLFMGSLLIESFFGIPGLGSYMLDAIRSQDFAIVRTMVFIGSILYILGLILTDISYTWADPESAPELMADFGLKPVLLWSDILIFMLVIALTLFFYRLRNDPQTRERWSQVFSSRLGMVTFTVIMVYVGVALLDSMHFRRALANPEGVNTTEVFYDNKVTSVLDVLLDGMGDRFERTYSAPFALKSFEKSNIKDEQGNVVRDFDWLEHAGQHLASPDEKWADIILRSVIALAWGLAASAVVIGLQWTLLRRSPYPWFASWAMQATVICFVVWLVNISHYYHVLGTDQGGADVAFQSIKGIRTGVLLGTLATLVMLPIAVSLGVMAGYFKGWVDDVVQYLYTTLSSIPGILLIAASVLLFQVYIDLNPDFFSVGMEKADARFIALCFILGLTSWSTLCRLIRAETLKISQLGYVQAAHAFGVSHSRILVRHILPNVVHIILITFVLDFSALVLAEAVLSYIGVGIDPSMGSWGNMINGARSELSREPAVWWTLTGAFFFMFTLVLAANLFSDLVRDAFDPRSNAARSGA